MNELSYIEKEKEDELIEFVPLKKLNLSNFNDIRLDDEIQESNITYEKCQTISSFIFLIDGDQKIKSIFFEQTIL